MNFLSINKRIKLLIVIQVLSLFFSDSIIAQNIDEKRDKAQRIEQEIKQIDEQIRRTRQVQKNTLNELVLIKRKVATRERLLNELDNEIKHHNTDLDSKTDSIRILQNKFLNLQDKYKKLIISAYSNRDTRKWFMYIFASDNIEQGYRRWVYLKNYAKAINKQGEEIKALNKKINTQKEAVQKLQEKALKRQVIRQVEYDKFKQDEKVSSKYVNSLEKKQTQLKQQLSNKKREVAALNREIEKMLSAAIAQSKTESKNTIKNKENIKLSEEFGSNRGKLPWPMNNGVVVEGFGAHEHPVLKNVQMPFNNGINISATNRSTVTSVFGGIVKQIIIIPGYNHCILVQHGKYFTFYCKLGTVSVRVGDKVTTGQKLGNINEDTLHFELWNGSTKQNPETWLR